MQSTTVLATALLLQLQALRDRLSDERGQTSIEWLGIGAVVVAIALAVAGNSESIGTAIENAFNSIVNRAAEVE